MSVRSLENTPFAGLLRASNETQWIFQALDFMAHGITVYDANSRLAYANQAYAKIYKLDEELLPIGAHVTEVFRRQAVALIDDPGMRINYIQQCLVHVDRSPMRREMTELSALRHLPDGRTVRIERREADGGFSITTHEDVSERLLSQRKIEHAAQRDPLTNLYNRLYFTNALDDALANLAPADGVGLLLIDLDHFKQVNDLHGHAVGDALLNQLTQRLTRTIRNTDVCARLGGDEFAILQVPAASDEAAAGLAKRIVTELSKPYHCDGATIVVGVSAGIARSTSGSTDGLELMKQADFALYRAKGDGRGRYQFFEETLGQERAEKQRIESAMRRALVTDGFTLNYQPIINMQRGRVEVVEALLRWQLDGEWVSPADFIPLAEENGLILALGDWVLRTACAEIRNLPEHVAVAVNVSPFQFRNSEIVDSVRNALAETGIAPSRLQLEVTESLLLENSAHVRAALDALAKMGCTIALDDFGTGYSSLNYLTSFPFDKIKIDRSFIQDLPGDARKLAVFEAIAELGRGLGVSTTIEGVETNEQLQLVDRKSGTEVQGFLLAKPTAPDALLALISDAERILRDSPCGNQPAIRLVV